MKRLNGLRVLNTRPRNQAQALSQAINAAGGKALDFPCLLIQPTPLLWLDQLPSLLKVNQAIFTSPNAVNFFFRALKQHKNHWPLNISITAIGQGSADALKTHNCVATYCPMIADSEHLVQLTNFKRISEQTILLIKGVGGRELIANTLQTHGAKVVILEVYHRSLPPKNPTFNHLIWRDDALDIILFTSQEAMHNIFTLFNPAYHPWLWSKPCVVISPRLAKAAELLGMQDIIVSRYDEIMNTLQGFVHDRHYK